MTTTTPDTIAEAALDHAGMFNSAVLTAPMPDRTLERVIDEIEDFYAGDTGGVLLYPGRSRP